MSTLKVDNIRHSATSDAITMASDGTCTAKLTDVEEPTPHQCIEKWCNDHPSKSR